MAIPRHYMQKNINKNRRKKLKERMKRVIDNSSIAGSEKVFIKQALSSILQEYAELWECRNTLESE